MDTLRNTDLPSHISFPDEFPYEFGSPAESVVGSTDSETDQEELIAGLTRQLKNHNISQNHEKLWGLSASPQSTLTAAVCWSGSGSPNGPSQAPSPPTTPYAPKEDSWNLIYAAAGQLNKGYAIPPRNFAPAYPSPVPKPTSTGVFLNQCFPHIPPPHTNQFQSSVWGSEVKDVRPSHQQNYHQNRISNIPSEIGKSVRQLGFSQSAWPPLQSERQHRQNTAPPPPQAAQRGFTLRSIPVGRSEPGVKRECAGTGVFLPRRFVNLNESRNKTGLNPPANKNSTPKFQNQTTNYDAILARRKELLAQQSRSVIQDNVVRLPQEWTY